MSTPDEYQSRWVALAASSVQRGELLAIVVRLGGGRHQMVEHANLDQQLGLEGDRWRLGARRRERQISVLSQRALATLSSAPARWADAGDNLIVDFDLSEANLPVGSQLRIGEVVLRVSATPHLGCTRFAARFGEEARSWVNDPVNRHLRLRGVYCEVIGGGIARCGDVVLRCDGTGGSTPRKPGWLTEMWPEPWSEQASIDSRSGTCD